MLPLGVKGVGNPQCLQSGCTEFIFLLTGAIRQAALEPALREPVSDVVGGLVD